MALLVACAGSGTDDGGGKAGNGGTTTGGSTNGGSTNGGSTTGGSTTGGSTTGGSTTGGSTTGGSTTGGSTTGGSTTGSTTGGTTGGGGAGLMTTGGYYTAGTLKGYWFTAADMGGSTIAPADFSTSAPICAKGSGGIVKMMDYSGTWGAILGYNINQAAMPPNDPVATALSPTGTIAITLSGTVPMGTRLKVAVGGTDYCKEISSGPNTVKLSDLKKECWMAGGTSYAGEPVPNIAVQVSTNDKTANAFDFCVTSFTYTP